MPVRAKFVVESVKPNNPDDLEGEATVELRAVYAGGAESENSQFWKLTPSGFIQLSTINAAAWKQFEIGKEYYIDFTRAE